MTILVVAFLLDLQARLSTSYATFVVPLIVPMDGPDGNWYNSNRVDPRVRGAMEWVVTNFFYILAALAIVVGFNGIRRWVTADNHGETKAGRRETIGGFLLAFICFFNKEFASLVFAIIGGVTGIK